MRFYAPLAIATSIVVLLTLALVQARPQPDVLLLTSSLVATATFCIGWQASLRLAHRHPRAAGIDVLSPGLERIPEPRAR